MAKKGSFTGPLNANLSIRVPVAIQRKMRLQKGDLLDVEIMKIEEASQ